MQRTIEAFLGRLPFVERGRPFIETGKGRVCQELLSKKRDKLWEERKLAEVLILDNEIQLHWEERPSPYRKEKQYKGVALRPSPTGGIDVYYTYLAPVDSGRAVTDWVIYRAGVPARNGIPEILRAEATLSEHVDMAMMFAWHHPHDFRDGPLNSKK